jgi:hypothetical protein
MWGVYRCDKNTQTDNNRQSSFCILDSLTQHVSTKEKVITRQIRQKRNYYENCIILFNIIHICVLDPIFTYHKITR